MAAAPAKPVAGAMGERCRRRNTRGPMADPEALDTSSVRGYKDIRKQRRYAVAAALCRSRRDPHDPDADPQDPSRRFDPSEASIRHHVDRALVEGGVDVIIGSAWERNVLHDAHARIPFVEFGYPQDRAHFIVPAPHLGFSGVPTWAQRIYEALAAGGRLRP